jgi:MFS transporter, ACS family, hexuronate transporter
MRVRRNVQGSALRWWVIVLLFLATLINFFNRLTVAVLAPVIMAELHLSIRQFASLTTWFLIAYTISQGVSGKLYDAIGTRLGFLVSIVLWSISSVAQAFSRGLFTFNCLRFALGLGEGGTWPGAAKAIAEWFPLEERALAMGICNSGTALGTLLATPLLIWLEVHFGWRTTFLAVGLLGFAWLIPWLLLNRSSALTQPPAGPPRASLLVRLRWRDIVRHREAWAIFTARFFGDSVWWFYITWLPLYLYRVRHFSLHAIGMFAWMPFLAADLGSLFGGWLSGALIRAGWSVNRARKGVILGAMLLMCSGIPAAFVHNGNFALGLIAVVLFGFQSWIGNVQTLSSDYFPNAAVASVMGLGGVGAGLGAMLLTEVTGIVLVHGSYTPIFLIAGVLPLLATASLFLLGGSIRPIAFATPARVAPETSEPLPASHPSNTAPTISL